MTNAKTPATRPDVPEVERYNPALHTWDDLSGAADTVLGADLVSTDEALFDALVGVPFLITRVVYRPSEYGTSQERNYVSVEAVIAPEHILKRRRVNTEGLPFDPESQVVFNDGSTGIARQITAYLYATGRISLPDPIHAEGKAGESSYDLPVSQWPDVHAGELRFTPTGQAVYICDVRLSCPRGIRISDGYDFEGGKDGKTRYLA